ncbi:aldo/keto reductase [Dactylosporangium sp. AC04546]|uniref:aldo/keto reductase n=1 Tax=Dactylosporangium sp. AC04546 TaxID=2862460 RepID=UPI001EDDC740|nr:aldo/keto reductase [Dactylosporangium sp. AC04546]WVK89031.1 aldo/keto reductase [Dactylosporangium sp. AC04546]
MKYTRMGLSGLEVSRLSLGCMGFGHADKGTHPWTIGLDEARPIVRAALDAGITVFDTANMYSHGTSEQIIGTLLNEFGVRNDVVLATKVYVPMGPGPKGRGLSRAAIFAQVDASLRRLGTDYIDLYQIHRYDPDVPIEETMEALNDLVRSGRVRYLGASSMFTWQFARAQYRAAMHGWTRFIAMQDQYNLLMREEEREMHPFCLAEGIGVMGWSPLARGRLALEWGAVSERMESDEYGKTLYTFDEESNREIVDAVGRIAGHHGASRAQVALAWTLHQPAVSTSIVGPTRPEHLTDALGALDLVLSEEERKQLEAPYTPRLPVGF